jgi:hypothetical protein
MTVRMRGQVLLEVLLWMLVVNSRIGCLDGGVVRLKHGVVGLEWHSLHS